MKTDCNIVLDTNVLVSSIWSPGRNATDILTAVFAGKYSVCYDYRILEEYERVLNYSKFQFSKWEIHSILDPIIKNGISVVSEPILSVPFPDESDRKFYEVAKFCQAILVTGNLKHFPPDTKIISVADFCRDYL